MICSLTGCTEEVAREAYDKTEDVLLATDTILFPNQDMPVSRKREREDINEHEQYLNKMRKTMEAIDGNIAAHRSTTSNPLVDAVSDETQAPHEETVQQSNYLPEYPLPSPVEEAQRLETVYPPPPECSFGSQ